jgi:hypothetical protein
MTSFARLRNAAPRTARPLHGTRAQRGACSRAHDDVDPIRWRSWIAFATRRARASAGIDAARASDRAASFSRLFVARTMRANDVASGAASIAASSAHE